jgi:capsular polysaccharide biosynthesis protein
MYLETRMKEAGIIGNITLIGPPATTFAPARIAGKKIIIAGIIAGLVLGIGIALLLDFIKGPIRHESDITDVVRIPVMGHLPRV